MIALPTLRQLTYLVSLADHRHFGKAAEACLATQSTLSAGLQELESLLGVRLVERTRRRVMLTPLGEEVAARSRHLLIGAGEIVALARATVAPLTGSLRLGVIPTIAPFRLPGLIPILRQHHPALRLLLREDMTIRLLDRLAAGDMEAALLALPFSGLSSGEELEIIELESDPFLFVAPLSHPLAKVSAIHLKDIPSEELLLLEDGHCLGDQVMAACGLSRRNGNLLATSLHTLVPMVASGLGTTLLPRMAVAAGILQGTDLVARPLLPVNTGRRIGLVWRRSYPRRDEMELLGQVLKGISREENEPRLSHFT